jgi:hypothetical protein
LDWNCNENVDIGKFSEEDWTLTADIRAFAEILSVIIVGTWDGQCGRTPSVPTFVSEIIEAGLLAGSRTGELMKIFKTPQQNESKIVDGVGFDEVSAFRN